MTPDAEDIVGIARNIVAGKVPTDEKEMHAYGLSVSLLRAVEALEWYAAQYYVFCKENHSPCDTADIITQDHGKRARECLAGMGRHSSP